MYSHLSDTPAAASLRTMVTTHNPEGSTAMWRALYRRVGELFVIAAVGPEAQSDKRGFYRACEAALKRLGELEEG
jgi:hypothetical protein